MTQTMLAEQPVSEAPDTLPELWTLTILRSGSSPDISSAIAASGVPSERAVFVTDQTLSYVKAPALHVTVHSSDRDATLWNAGLNFIKRQQPVGALWDVLLFDPARPLPVRYANSLRHHMRTLDVWMAEPDLFDSIGSRAYKTFWEADHDQVYPQVAVVSGEAGVLFDRRFFDGADAWADYCRRTRYIGGSVVVSPASMAEMS